MKLNFKKLMENKLYMTLGLMAIILIVIILIILLVSLFSSSRLKSYSDLENKLVTVSKKYFNDNSDRLPTDLKSTSEVSISTLVEKGYLKEIEELTPNKETCTGSVVVKNTNNDHYNYEAYIDCGDFYKTQSISDYIKENTEIVYELDGLYYEAGDLVYRGEKINNYLNFAGRSYRIVSINNDNTLTIIDDSLTEKFYWDNRYNSDKRDNYGIDDYSLSKMRDGLINVYNSNDYFNDTDRSLLEIQPLCVGKVNEDEPFSRSIECDDLYNGDIVGLLPITWYTYASLDVNCIYSNDSSCQNYNYLAEYGDYWWLLTTDYDTTYYGYSVSSGGGINEVRLSSNAYFRDVLRITDKAVYVSGDGSKDNPYVIK